MSCAPNGVSDSSLTDKDGSFSGLISITLLLPCLLLATTANAILVQKKVVTQIDVARLKSLLTPEPKNTSRIPAAKCSPASALFHAELTQAL